MDDTLVQNEIRKTWNGTWIWPEPVQEARNAYALFRRPFEVRQAAHLDLCITADSHYMLYLDGQFIARGPARAPLAYYLFDHVSLDLRPGPHCLAVLVHHVGEVNATMMKGRPGLLADGTLTVGATTENLSTRPQQTANGGDRAVASAKAGGTGWKCQASTAWKKDLPCLMSHFGFWEECDLQNLPARWTAAVFDDSAWAAAVDVGKPPCAPWGQLIERDIAMPRYEKIAMRKVTASGTWTHGATDPGGILSKTVSLRQRSADTTPPAAATLPFRAGGASPEGGRYLTVDFGRTVSGYVQLTVADATPGQTMDVSYEEILDEHGAVNPERSYAHLSDRFILRSGDYTIRTTHPRGFRYVTIDLHANATPAALTVVSALEETYPFVLQGSYESSDRLLNALYPAAANTVRVCTTDAFTDCPTRERVQWMEDLYMHSLTAMYAFGDTRMVRHALFQAAQCALPDGRINGFFPSERTNCAFASSSLMWLAVLAEYWRFTGAEDDVAQLLPTCRALLRMIDTQKDKDGLIANWPSGQFWDWAPLDGQGCILLTNAAYVHSMDRLAREPRFREVLPHDIATRLDVLRQRIHERFWLESAGTYSDARLADGSLSTIRSQDANVMAVLAGVCPPERRVELLRRIIDPVELGPVPIGEESLREEKRPTLTKVVPAGTLWFGHWLCRALFEAGLDNEALAQMRMLWGPFEGWPTFPETRIRHGNTGHCHGWASGPAFLLPAYVVGLQPTAPGWKEALFSPHVGDLTSASGRIRTPLGNLDASWRHDGKHLDISLHPPAEMTVVVRYGNVTQVVQGGKKWKKRL